MSSIRERTQIFSGMSILAVGANGIVDEKLEAFSFLCWATGPERFCQIASFEEARKLLLEEETKDTKWNLVFCDASRKKC